ncbi:hypothetical protein VP01_2061g1 [Puccinia sorghi]|uniref:Uncharacterized protein n=1 Tax=Puccinia sorghi TaxID=27349 RepID=A0A0L6VAP3_9BASI|nr:hypothetical protein VP01_2061g1 [Puccinia sorghi]
MFFNMIYFCIFCTLIINIISCTWYHWNQLLELYLMIMFIFCGINLNCTLLKKALSTCIFLIDMQFWNGSELAKTDMFISKIHGNLNLINREKKKGTESQYILTTDMLRSVENVELDYLSVSPRYSQTSCSNLTDSFPRIKPNLNFAYRCKIMNRKIYVKGTFSTLIKSRGDRLAVKHVLKFLATTITKDFPRTRSFSHIHLSFLPSSFLFYHFSFSITEGLGHRWVQAPLAKLASEGASSTQAPPLVLKNACREIEEFSMSDSRFVIAFNLLFHLVYLSSFCASFHTFLLILLYSEESGRNLSIKYHCDKFQEYLCWGTFDAQDQDGLNCRKGIAPLGTEDEANGGGNFPNQNPGMPHAKKNIVGYVCIGALKYSPLGCPPCQIPCQNMPGDMQYYVTGVLFSKLYVYTPDSSPLKLCNSSMLHHSNFLSGG